MSSEQSDVIVARIANGPHTLLVVGTDEDKMMNQAEAWVEEREGQRFTPTYYSNLAFVHPDCFGVAGEIYEEDGVCGGGG